MYSQVQSSSSYSRFSSNHVKKNQSFYSPMLEKREVSATNLKQQSFPVSKITPKTIQPVSKVQSPCPSRLLLRPLKVKIRDIRREIRRPRRWVRDSWLSLPSAATFWPRRLVWLKARRSLWPAWLARWRRVCCCWTGCWLSGFVVGWFSAGWLSAWPAAGWLPTGWFWAAWLLSFEGFCRPGISSRRLKITGGAGVVRRR